MLFLQFVSPSQILRLFPIKPMQKAASYLPLFVFVFWGDFLFYSASSCFCKNKAPAIAIKAKMPIQASLPSASLPVCGKSAKGTSCSSIDVYKRQDHTVFICRFYEIIGGAGGKNWATPIVAGGFISRAVINIGTGGGLPGAKT